MGKVYYKRSKKLQKRNLLRVFSSFLLITGISIVVYIFFPLLSWKLYFEPAFANQNINSPVPNNTLVSNIDVKSLITEASNTLSGIDYTNAQNWFPSFRYQKNSAVKIQNYTISIPKIKLKDAVVSTIDTDLANHLVNYGGTAVPSDKGNAVIFGHSTLPQLYEDKNYKTVFTFLYQLIPGDEIIVNVGQKNYKYKIENVTVVDPENTTVLEQNYSDSFITLVTCTPPGTIWKRLVVKARIVRV